MNVVKLMVDISTPWNSVSDCLPFISPERRERISRMRRESDRLISLYTELLIRNEASEKLNIPQNQITFGCNSHGKPFIPNALEYFFSVSHSHNCIVFADSQKPVGVDVEYISQRRLSLAKRFFTANEYNFITESPSLDKDFFRIWTSKEAYVKMLGTGLATPFSSFDVLDAKLKDCFCFKENYGFMITVCSENAATESFSIEETAPDRILKISDVCFSHN